MDRQSNQGSQAITACFRHTNVWKELRMGTFFQTAWVISDVSLLIAITAAAIAEGLGIGMLLLWPFGFTGGWLLHRIRKPHAANEKLLAGALGVAGTILFIMGQKLVEMIICLLLLGVSAACSMTIGSREHMARLCSFFAGDETELEECQHQLVRKSVFPNVILGGCMMLLLMHKRLIAISLVALCSSLCQVFAALNDPMDKHVLEKLILWEKREAEGIKSAALQTWLNEHLAEKYRRPWFILFLEWIIRMGYSHEVIMEEPYVHDDADPVIYLCNHATIYGPVTGYVFTPSHVRPWVISNIMVDMQETVPYLYKYTFSQVKWIPRSLRYPVTVAMSRLAHWAFRELDALPVYRDHPMELMKTFRKAVAAMECGDDMLIFPENPNAAGIDHGYEREGVGELFSGFAMIGQLWHRKTGRCCRFVPMFADRDTHVLHIGKPVIYDPANESAAERQRIADEVSAEMNRLAKGA